MWQARLATVVVLGLLLPAAGLAQEDRFRTARIADEASSSGAPETIATGDLNKDGLFDAAVTNIRDSSVTIWEGLPALPEFGLPREFGVCSEIEDCGNVPIGGFPADVLLVDVDDDKVLDMIVSNATSDEILIFKGNGDLSFQSLSSVLIRQPGGDPQRSRPSGLALGDFNRDGNDDIVVANEGTEGTHGTVDVFFGNGAGEFTNCCPDPDTCTTDIPVCPSSCVEGVEPACTPLATEALTHRVAVGLVNSDQFLDILALNTRSNSISIFFGDGTGRFTSGGTVATGQEPRDFELVDVNHDHHLDIVTTQITSPTDSTPDSVAVLLGTGTGTFGPRTTYPVGTDPRGLSVGDVNGDGDPDIVVANNRSVDVSVLLGDGTGVFGRARQYVADSQPMDVNLLPFDENDTLDIVSANVAGNDGTLATLFNLGDGSFNAVEDISADFVPTSAVAADVDNDGLPDVVMAREGGTLAIFSALRTGGFQPPRVISLGGTNVRPLGIVVADFNSDGFLDVAFTDNNLSRLGVLLGRRRGEFGPVKFFATAGSPVAIASGDFNNDHHPDLAVTNNTGPPGQVSMLLGQGDGNFGAFTTVPVDAVPNYMVAGDFNNDGRDDLVVLNVGGDDVSVAGRTFSLIISGNPTVDSRPTMAQFPAALTAGYINDDDALDFIFGSTSTAGGEPSLKIYLNDPENPLTFTRRTAQSGESAVGLAARDYDGDLLVDVLVASASANEADLMLNTGVPSAPLQRESNFGVSRMPVAAIAADFNGDGCYDAATVNTDNSSRNLSVLTNNCTLPIPRGIPRGDANGDGVVTAADTIAVALEVMDGDGQAVERIGGGSFQAQPTVDNNGDGEMNTKDVIGVDANGDGLVTGQDANAAARLIFLGT